MKPIKPIPNLDQLTALYRQIGAVAVDGERLIVRSPETRLEFYSPVAAWHWWKTNPYTVARLVKPVEEVAQDMSLRGAIEFLVQGFQMEERA